MIGEKLSHFRIEGKLGSGGMGEVFRATDVQLRRQVAIKRLHPELADDTEYRRRFLREAQHAANIVHPSIAAIYDILENEGDLYLVMEYVNGRPLKDWRYETGGLQHFLSIAEQCAEALAAAHAQGVAHRDIKPANILLTEARQVKMLDFGLARNLKSRDPLVSTQETPREEGARGTPAYMAPEVLRGDRADFRADIFSLGVVFYEMLTGHHPFLDRSLATTVTRILTEPPIPVVQINPRAPEDLSRLVARMLEKDRTLRLASAEDLLSELRTISRDHFGTSPHPLGPAPRKRRALIHHPLAWIAACLLVILVISSGLLELPLWTHLPDNPTLAIQPYGARQGDPEVDAFCAGLCEALNQNLNRLGLEYPLMVIPAAQFHDINPLGSEVESKLGANLLLRPEVSYDRGDLRIQLNLIAPGSGQRLRTAEVVGAFLQPAALIANLTASVLEMLDIELDSPAALLQPGLAGNANAQNFYLRGLGHFLQQDWDSALQNLEQALTFDRNFSRAEAVLSRTLLAQAGAAGVPPDFAEVEAHCLRALELDHNSWEAQLALGELRLAQGRHTEAMHHFERAFELGPLDQDVLRRLMLTHEQSQKLEDLAQHLRTAVDRQPNFWLGHSWLGLVYYQQGQPGQLEKAVAEFSRVHQLAPRYLGALNSLSVTYARMGCPELSLATNLEALRIEKASGLYTNIATTLFYLGRHAEAASYAQQGIVLLIRDPKSARNYLDFGNLADVLYWAVGPDRSSATPHYQEALRRVDAFLLENPGDPQALRSRALYLSMLGKVSEGMRLIDQLIQTGQEDGRTYYKAAVVHQMAGDSPTAVRYLQKSLSLGEPVEFALQEPIFRESAAFQEVLDPYAHTTHPCPIPTGGEPQ